MRTFTVSTSFQVDAHERLTTIIHATKNLSFFITNQEGQPVDTANILIKDLLIAHCDKKSTYKGSAQRRAARVLGTTYHSVRKRHHAPRKWAKSGNENEGENE